MSEEKKTQAVPASCADRPLWTKGELFMFFTVSVFFIFIFSGVPWTIDILYFWRLHLQRFPDIASFSIHYGNGRLLGNIGTIYLINYPRIGLVLRAVTLSSLPPLLCRALGLQRRSVFLAAYVLLLTVTPAVYGQCYAWICGFQNYVPPLVLFLIGLVLIRAERPAFRFASGLRIAAIALCGVCMQLYVEHSSCINIVCTAGILYICVKRKTHLKEAFVFFIASVFGGILMFLIPLFYTVGSEVSGYRSDYFSGGFSYLLFGAVKNGTKLICKYTESSAGLALLAFLQIRLIRICPACFPGKSAKRFSVGLAGPAICFAILQLVDLKPWYGKLAIAESAAISLLFAVFTVSFVLSSLLLRQSGRGKTGIFSLALFGLSVFSLLPLIFVEPIPYRCVLHAYLFVCSADLVLLDELLSDPNEAHWKLRIQRVAALTLAAVVFCQILVFSDIRRMGRIREDYIRTQCENGEPTADYFMLPSDYIYDYWDEYHYRSYYSELYQNPISFQLLPADQWFRDHYYFY